MGIGRRDFALSLLGLGAFALRARPAQASIALALSLEELVTGSTRIWVGTPLEGRARWETTKFGRRIVTDSRVRLDRPVFERAAPVAELWLRTLGGIVGDVGQLVEGEARPALGQPCLLFLRPQGNRHHVVGMAQGLFRIRHDAEGTPRLAPSGGLHLIRSKDAAIERLADRELDEAIDVIRAVAP